MRKLSLLVLMLLLCFTITACGTIDSKTEKTSQNLSNKTNSDSSSSSKDVKNNISASPAPTPAIKNMTSTEGYADPEREISVLGLKEYTKLKTKTYTDRPAKGKKYLVLFIKYRNRSYNDEYINVGNWTTKLDNKKIENTYLVNQPKHYSTLFQSIPSETDYAGYVVWEVPTNWKTLHIKYTGWKDIDHVILEMTLTPKDLKNPPDYNDLD